MLQGNVDPIANKASLLLREGKSQEAIEFLNGEKDLSRAAMDYLCDAYFQSRNWAKAYETLKLQKLVPPLSLYHQRLEFKILNNWGRYEEALACVKQFIANQGNDIEALGIGKICAHFLKRDSEALQYGQSVLQLKDQFRGIATPSEPLGNVNKDGVNVIAYSVWGENKAYLYGAAINAELAKRFFPTWTVRLYVSSALPADVVSLYRSMGAEVILADLAYPDVPTYFWRFLVADDEQVRHFLCRDADCRLSPQEASLVDSWMRSGKRFHAIRDHVLHDDLMLAGLWGGQASKGIRMREMIATYFNGKQTNKYGHDQIFLGQVVWPRIKQQIFVHDKYYWTPGVKSHAHGLDFSFGEGHIDAEAVRMEAAALGLI